LTADTEESHKEANLLCADAITNFKTVQSFGHEDKISAKYESILAPVWLKAKSTQIKTGFAIGLSNFFSYSVFAAMFYAGGKIIQNHYDEEAGEYTINPQDVITAIFVMFLGAN